MFVIGNHFSVTFAGNTRSLPKKEASERSSNWVGSGLALKFSDLKGFPRTNALAYCANATKVFSFVTGDEA